jgi:hypothetical protein
VVDAPLDLGAVFDVDYRVDMPAEPIRVEAAQQLQLALEVVNGTTPIAWEFLSGTLPQGLVLQSVQGRIVGSPMETGSFEITMRAVDGRGLEAEAVIHLDVGPPALTIERLNAPFLGTGPPPTQLQRVFLDRLGNENGLYDVGDLRAFLRAYPEVAQGGPPAGAAGSAAATAGRAAEAIDAVAGPAGEFTIRFVFPEGDGP